MSTSVALQLFMMKESKFSLQLRNIVQLINQQPGTKSNIYSVIYYAWIHVVINDNNQINTFLLRTFTGIDENVTIWLPFVFVVPCMHKLNI